MKFLEKQTKANGLIEAYCRNQTNLVFIDVGEVLLSDGKPNAELFLNDGLHLNDQGYEKWTKNVKPYLSPSTGR